MDLLAARFGLSGLSGCTITTLEEKSTWLLRYAKRKQVELRAAIFWPAISHANDRSLPI